MHKLGMAVSTLREEKSNIDNSKHRKFYEGRQYQADIERLENMKNQRLEWLRKKDNDAYQAVMWLRQNRDKFEGEVFEPTMLEVIMRASRKSIFIESLWIFICMDQPMVTS